MKLKFLYALGLLLCLSTVASSNECKRSNECTRLFHPTAGKGHIAACACDGKAPSVSASTEADGETDHAYSLTLIKLLYI